jgi:CheY-like chemotaxis protein
VFQTIYRHSNSILEHDSNYYNDRSSIENAISNNIKTKSAATKSIMIVDDEQDILFAFRLILNEIGDIGSSDIRIETFENSIDALLFFTETDPSFYDLVIIDIKMPGINGFQLYKIMKALTRGTSTTNFYLCLLLSMQKS